MLPDLPALKRDIAKLLHEYFAKSVRQKLGVVDEVPKHLIHEGNRMRTLRADGSIDESELHQASAEMTIGFDEVPTLTIQQRLARIEAMAESMASQIGSNFFVTIGKVLEGAGQAVDGRGRPFGVEVVFEVLEKMHFDFDASGNPKAITVVVHPEQTERAKEIVKQLSTDPALQRRYADLIERKRHEWHDREASRKLVG